MKIKFVLSLLLFGFFLIRLNAQRAMISGTVVFESQPVSHATVFLKEVDMKVTTDSNGNFTFKNIPEGMYTLFVSYIGYEKFEKKFFLNKNSNIKLSISLSANSTLLNEVVLTSVSKATRIRETPVAITSVSGKQIEQTNEGNIIDALVKHVPGLNAVKTGANISKPFIRGLGYNRVLTLFDGIRQEGQQWGDEHGIEVDAYTISRAEVIKGPASLMYGSDALAGVVSLFPFTPNNKDNKLHTKFISEYQTNNNLIGNGLQLNYDSKHFMFALSGSYRMAKNYRNPIDGRVYLTGFSEKNISAITQYKTDRGFTKFSFTMYDNRQGIPDGSRDSLSRKFTKQIYEANQDTVQNRTVVSKEELNAYKIPPLSQHIRHYRMYLHSFYQIGKSDIDFLLGLQQNIRKEFNHPTMIKQAGMYVRLNTLNYGLRYNAPKFANIETTVGINGMLQNNKSLDATDFPIPDYKLYEGGGYLHAKWKHKKVTVSGGVRYDLRFVKWNDFYVKQNVVTGFDEHTDNTDLVDATLQFSAYKKRFHGISASTGITYEVSKKISLKANVGRAYRAPNITEMASNGLDPGAHIIYLGNRNFNSEFSVQEDIGLHASLKNFSADISIFNNHIQNYIYLNLVTDANGNPVVDAQENRTYQYQQSAAQLYGAELWFAVHPQKLIGFRIDNSLAVVYGFNKDPAYKNSGTNGQYLPLIPPLKLMNTVSQTIAPHSKWFASVTPKVEMEFAAAQNKYLGLNGTETPTPGYALFNCGVVTELKQFKSQKLQIQLQVNNLLDKAYQSNLNRLKYFEMYAYSPNEFLGIYNMGRNFCFKIIYGY